MFTKDLLSRRSLLLSLMPGIVRGAGLERQVGVTTSSFTGHLALKPAPGQIALLDLPRFMRDELDMRVIDLNTRTLPERPRRSWKLFAPTRPRPIAC